MENEKDEKYRQHAEFLIVHVNLKFLKVLEFSDQNNFFNIFHQFYLKLIQT